MAEPWACYSSCWNFLSTNENELARSTPWAPTNDTGTFSYTPAVSRDPTPAPAPVVVPAPTEAVAKYIDKDVQKTTQLALNLFIQGQEQAQNQVAIPALKLCKKPLKASFPDLYYGNLYRDCYQFCQQYKNHFNIAEAKGPNWILFAALFLQGLVTQQWLQHKQDHNGAAPMT